MSQKVACAGIRFPDKFQSTFLLCEKPLFGVWTLKDKGNKLMIDICIHISNCFLIVKSNKTNCTSTKFNWYDKNLQLTTEVKDSYQSLNILDIEITR